MPAVTPQQSLSFRPTQSTPYVETARQHNTSGSSLEKIKSDKAPRAIKTDFNRSMRDTNLYRSNSTASMSSIESVKSLESIESNVRSSASKPSMIELNSLRQAINDGAENEAIISSVFAKQGFAEASQNELIKTTLHHYNQQKKTTPLEPFPGAKAFIHGLQKNKVDFCFCSNASQAKTQLQLKKTFDQAFIVYGKCKKGDPRQSQQTAITLAHQYANKYLLLIGNEKNDAAFSRVLRSAGMQSQCILLGESAKRSSSQGDILKHNDYLNYHVENHAEGFAAAMRLIQHIGVNNCAVIMDVHGTVLDTAALLKDVMTNAINDYNGA